MRKRVEVLSKYLKKQAFWGRIKIESDSYLRSISYITKRFELNIFEGKVWGWNIITKNGVCLIEGLTDEEVKYLIEQI